MKLSERLSDAHCAGDTAEVIKLVRMMALSITRGDEEAAEAATDEIVMALAKGKTIDSFSVWARVVIKRTASKVWASRRLDDSSFAEDEDESFMDSVDPDWERIRGWADDAHWLDSSLEDFGDFFPSPDAYRAFCMQANGKTTAEIAAEFMVDPGTMRVRMHRWAKQAAARHRKYLAERRNIQLAYAAERKSEALKKNA